MVKDMNSPGTLPKWRLHPLIHTFSLATMVLHVGAVQKRRECGLKYVMQTFQDQG